MRRLSLSFLDHAVPACILLTIVLSLGAAWYMRAEVRAGGTGFPLDDSWIHLQFARHIALDGQLAFNRFEPSSGSTAPLWTLLLGLLLRSGVDPVLGAKALGIALSAVAACLTWLLTRALTGSTAAAWLAGLCMACSPRMLWASVSGMEVPLYLALCLGALLVYATSPDRHAPVWGLLAAMSGTARPETFVLLPVLGLVHVIACMREGRTHEAWRPVMKAALPAAAVLLVYAAVNLSNGPYPWPTTLAAKSEGKGLLDAVRSGNLTLLVKGLVHNPLWALNVFVRFFFEQSALLTMLVLPGMLALGGFLSRSHPRGPAVLVALLLMPMLPGALAPTLPVTLQEGRYVAHGLALAFVTAAAGAAALAGTGRARWPVVAFAVIAVARLASQGVAFAPRHAAMVANITSMHLAMGKWLQDNTPPGALIAANDIGGIAWASGRRILDLEGLVTPEIVPFKKPGERLTFLERARPQYLVIFPEWYPDLVARSDLFREIHRVTVPRVSAAHDSMVVYETPWTRQPEAADARPAERHSSP